MTNDDLITHLKTILDDADLQDSLRKYGEGYSGLRHDIECLITRLEHSRDKSPRN